MTQQSWSFDGQDDAADDCPPGVTLHRRWLAGNHAASLLQQIDRQPWLHDLQRRVQHYGYRYNYTSRSVTEADALGPLPAWLNPLLERAAPLMGQRPEQVIVNEYTPGQGIAPHIDSAAFGAVVMGLSLGGSAEIEFSRSGEQAKKLLLHHGDLLVMAGEGRGQWTHAIRPRKSDPVEGQRQPRARRVSVTMRTLARTSPEAR